MENLPDHILRQIAFNLPLKDRLRLERVSKQWQTALADPPPRYYRAVKGFKNFLLMNIVRIRLYRIHNT